MGEKDTLGATKPQVEPDVTESSLATTGSGREAAQYSEPTTLVARAIFEHAPAAMLMVDQAGKIRHVNSAAEQLFGYTKETLVGEPIEILVPRDIRQRHERLRMDFMSHARSRPMAEGRRLTARKRDGTDVLVDIALSPISLETSETAVLVSILENPARERAEVAELFVNELTHRARNMFAIIGAISRQIAKNTVSVADFQASLEQRLRCLSISYQVFEKEKWKAALINDLVRSQISFVVRQDTPQIEIAGPDVRLQPAPAEYLALAIHELATNAVKHGALTVPTGKVHIRWSVDEAAKLFQFHWAERNGPPVAPSERQGFGSVILKSIVPAACGGTADLAFTPIGMSWNLNAPSSILSHPE